VVQKLRSRYGTLTPGRESAGAGTVFRSKYESAEHIASGGMGTVNLVRDVDLNRKVAMKTLKSDFANSPEYVSKFVEEAQIIGQLEHPNITPLYELGMTDDDSVYFTMKYVNGDTLDAIIKRLADGDAETHATYSFQRRVQIVQQICDALAFAHCKGVLHRDLKPSNIMIGRYGEVQVMDWGISKRMENRPDCEAEPDTPCADAAVSQVKLESPAPHQTAAGSVVGTAFYMSPEQIGGGPEALAPTSDIYSLGAMLYEFLTLHRPHKGKTVSEVLRQVLSEMPAPMASYDHPIQGHVPLQLQGIINRAMAKDPEERYQSIPEFHHDLQGFLDGHVAICCPATAVKCGLGKIDRFMDNHALSALVGLGIAVVGLIGAVVYLAIT
jgi:serine/threonine-protein kinase